MRRFTATAVPDVRWVFERLGERLPSQLPRRRGPGGRYVSWWRARGLDDTDRWGVGDRNPSELYGAPSGHMSTWSVPGPHVGRGPKGYQRSDERIREDICDRLSQHGQIDASEIQVSVSNCEVTLQGSVDSRGAKRLSEDIAEGVYGVRDVNNQLRVNREPGSTQSGSPAGKQPKGGTT